MTEPQPAITHATVQSRVLSLIDANGSYRCETQAEQKAAIKLNEKGLVRRDKKDGKLWHTPATYEQASGTGGDSGPQQPHLGASPREVADRLPALVELPEETEVAIPRHDASDLLATVERARALLDEGDVIAARMLASAAYDQARLAGQYGQRFKAAEQLVGKARQLQAEALLIEARAKIRIAYEWDAAHAAGAVSKGGRPKPVSNGNGLTASDIGLSRKEIHEARKLAAAEERAPGIVERAIQSRVEADLEPSRASLRAAIGTRSATAEEKGDQLYETPAEAIRTLLALESFSATVKEPAVGKGAILRPLEDAGYDVMIADLIDRSIATRHGELQQVGDFLLSVAGESVGVDIVTNPPYADLANAFPAHALREHKPRKMALLLNWNFAAGFEDPNRIFVMDENPPSRIYLFTRRLPMMHRDGWDGPKATSQMNTAWFVWEQNDAGTYGDGFPQLIRVDWKAYESAAPLTPGAGGNVAPMSFAPQPDEFARETPRKTIGERVEEEFRRACEWMRSANGPFDALLLRRGIGVRPSVADALIQQMADDGLIVRGDDGWTFPQEGADA